MPYCFDQAPSRLGTDSTKWDRYATRDQLDDVIPLWVADMDFACMPEVEQAIEHRAAHPIYGYSDVPRSLAEAIAGWERRQHGVEVDPGSIVWNTGVIYGLYSLVEWLVGPNEKVLVQLPAYPPFFNTPRALHREVAYTSLIEPKDESDDWRMDLEDMERQLASDPSIRMFILCNPYNPVGRCWTREELEGVLEICDRHSIYVISDEIHSDIIRPGVAFTSALACPQYCDNRLIVLGAGTKTFNLAGLKVSHAIFRDQKMKETFAAIAKASGLSSLNIFAVEAAQAAFTNGDEWKDGCVAYIYDNLAWLKSFVEERLPGVVYRVPEATYLAWLDCRSLGLSVGFCDRLKYEAGVEFQAGVGFGEAYEGYIRVNCACPRATLQEGMERFASWVERAGAK